MKSFSVINNYKSSTLLIWGIISILLCLQIFQNSFSLEAVLLAILYTAPLVLGSNWLSNFLLPKQIKKNRIDVFIAQFIIITIIIAIIIATIFYLFQHFTDIGYLKDSNLVDDDTFTSNFINQLLSASVINLAFCGIRFYYEHSKLQEVNYEYQLNSLQKQITPHFMFNILNHINYLMQSDIDLAQILLVKYSSILRYQLYNGEKKYSSVEEEIKFLNNYIDIEKIRWEDKIDINSEFIIDNGSQIIPSLLFITFIENAFKHVSRPIKSKGYINVSFKQNKDTIQFSIENSKYKTDSHKAASGIGLKNIKKRLDILFSDRYNLSIEDSNNFYSVKLIINNPYYEHR